MRWRPIAVCYLQNDRAAMIEACYTRIQIHQHFSLFSFFLAFHPSLCATPFACLFFYPSTSFCFSSILLCISMSPSVYLLLFIFSKFPLCIFPLTLSPAFFPPCSLYQVLYNVGSPDVLPASIRHFDSVQLSMIMYFSLNHSFSPFLSCLPSPSLFLPPKHTCTGTQICCSPCNPGLPWK